MSTGIGLRPGCESTGCATDPLPATRLPSTLPDAVRQAAEHGSHVTLDRLAAELSAQEARIYRAMLIQTAATIGGTVAILRLLG